MNKICILGSINMDLVVNIDKNIKKGETVLCKNFKKNSGGKGANQAIAAQRLGSQVYMIGKIGTDDYGKRLVDKLKNNNINTNYIFKDTINPTGMAIITVYNDGDNSIIVVPGANMNINSNEISNCSEIIKNSKIIVAQFETPIESTIEAFKIAKNNNVITILNPAPAKNIPDELLKLTDIIIPNETETFEITKIEITNKESIKKACEHFMKKGVKFIIITLGEKGCVLASKNKLDIIPAYKVNAIDTTAAGDSFIGALAIKLQNTKILNYEEIKKAMKYGNKVSSIVVQKEGAQDSIPYANEIEKNYKED